LAPILEELPMSEAVRIFDTDVEDLEHPF